MRPFVENVILVSSPQREDLDEGIKSSSKSYP
jgi:hypothetical protein